MTQQFVFPYLGKRPKACTFYSLFCVITMDHHKYCRDPFMKHWRRIYSHLQVVSEQLIAQCPSLSVQSGDLLRVIVRAKLEDVRHNFCSFDME